MLLNTPAMSLVTMRTMEASSKKATTLTTTMEQPTMVKVATAWIPAWEDIPHLYRPRMEIYHPHRHLNPVIGAQW